MEKMRFVNIVVVGSNQNIILNIVLRSVGKKLIMRHKVYREQPKIKKMISDRYKIYSQQPEIRARKKAYRERKKLKEIDNER